MESISKLKDQISALTIQVSKLTSEHSFSANPVVYCEYCSGPHYSFECPYDNYSSSFSEAQSSREELILRFMQQTDAMLQNQQTILEDLQGQINLLAEQLNNEPSNSREAVFEEEVSMTVKEEDENFLQDHPLEDSLEAVKEMEELAEDEEKDQAEFEELPNTRNQHEREEVEILYEKEEMEIINQTSNTTIEKLSKEQQEFMILPQKEMIVKMEYMPQKLDNPEVVTIHVSCDVSFDQLLRALIRETSMLFLNRWKFEGDPEIGSRDSRFLEPP